MSIYNSQKIIEDYFFLIGEDYNGATIKALLATPRNEPEFQEAIKQYARTYNSSFIYPATNNIGYTVTSILDRKRIDVQGLLLHAEIFSILNNKGIGIDYSNYGIDVQD